VFSIRYIGSEPPSHLDGTLAGDYGFDPLGLGTDAERLAWYVEAERQNGRWAMMAVAGILGTSALGVTPVWYEAGAKGTYDIPFLALIAIQAPVMGFLETKRLEGFKATGSVRPLSIKKA
jgi:light-harvesting complex I chlorophyll a/b binding protein 5